MKKTKNQKQKLIVLTPLFAALIAVVTFFIRIPTGIGYVHIGDGVIYLAACILPLPYALVSAAIGGGLSDFLGGYPQWILPTVIIKSLITLPFDSSGDKILTRRNLFMPILAGVITVFGYFAASLFMYSLAAAVLEITGYVVQSVFSGIVFVILGKVVDKNPTT